MLSEQQQDEIKKLFLTKLRVYTAEPSKISKDMAAVATDKLGNEAQHQPLAAALGTTWQKIQKLTLALELAHQQTITCDTLVMTNQNIAEINDLLQAFKSELPAVLFKDHTQRVTDDPWWRINKNATHLYDAIKVDESFYKTYESEIKLLGSASAASLCLLGLYAISVAVVKATSGGNAPSPHI